MSATSGLRTTNLPGTAVVDELLGHRGGSTVAIPVTSFAAQMAQFLGPGFATRAELLADLNWPTGAQAFVRGDENPAFNGVYRKDGSTGTGSWTRIGDLPSGALEEVLAAKAQAIAAAESADASAAILATVARRVPIPVQYFAAGTLAYDLPYNPVATENVEIYVGNAVQWQGLDYTLREKPDEPGTWQVLFTETAAADFIDGLPIRGHMVRPLAMDPNAAVLAPENFGAANTGKGAADDTAALLAWRDAIDGKIGRLTDDRHYRTNQEIVFIQDGTVITGRGIIEQTVFGLSGMQLWGNDCVVIGARGLSLQPKTTLSTALSQRYRGDPARSRASFIYNVGQRNTLYNIYQDGFVNGVNNAGERVWRQNFTSTEATPNTFKLHDTDAREDDAYVNARIRIMGGPDGNYQRIVAYNQATNTITIAEAWTSAPNGAGLSYVIHMRPQAVEVIGLRLVNYDFGLLGTWLDGFKFDEIYAYDGDQSQGEAAPPHPIYVTGDAGNSTDPLNGLRSRNGTIGQVSATNGYGAAIKFRGVDDLTITSILHARGMRGIATIEHCTNVTAPGFNGTDLGAYSTGRPVGVTVTGGKSISLGPVNAHFAPEYLKDAASVSHNPTALLIRSDLDDAGQFSQPVDVTWGTAKAEWLPGDAQGLTTMGVSIEVTTGATVTPAVIRAKGDAAIAVATGNATAFNCAQGRFNSVDDAFASSVSGTAVLVSFGSAADQCQALYDRRAVGAATVVNNGTACRVGQWNPAYQDTYNPQGQLTGTGAGMIIGQQENAATWNLLGNIHGGQNVVRMRSSGTGSQTLLWGFTYGDDTGNGILFNPYGNKVLFGGDAQFLVAGTNTIAFPAGGGLRFGAASTPIIKPGTGSPEGVVTAPPCSMWLRTDTGQLYWKSTGTGNAGWVAITIP